MRQYMHQHWPHTPRPAGWQASPARRALLALGGHDSPAGSCTWHVLGCGWSVREWALRQGGGGRPVRQEQAQGWLVATLKLLSAHYGLAERAAA